MRILERGIPIKAWQIRRSCSSTASSLLFTTDGNVKGTYWSEIVSREETGQELMGCDSWYCLSDLWG
jgi:hypothetical protein